MNKNILHHAWDKLTEARLANEAQQPVHPADQLRAELGRNALADPMQNVVQQLGVLGKVVLDVLRGNSNTGSNEQPTSSNSPEEPATYHDDEVVDVTADNQHLTSHEQ